METKNINIGSTDMLKDGEKKLIEVADKEILLARVDGKYYATGHTCPHYGAPLEDGLLHGKRLVCPWHHAAFDVTTGKLEEPPALDDLPHYRVKTKGNELLIELPEDKPGKDVIKMASGKELTYVIIGAGAAGTAAAQAMRDAGFEGRIVMLTYEDKLPYDRPSLSKSFMKGESPKEWLPLKDEDFYRNNRIEIKKRIYVDRIDKQNNSLYFSDGGSLTYHKLLIATGGRPVTPDIPGKDLENVFTLRSYEDTLEIIETAKHNKKAVIIGSSFIGMETASSLGENKVDVTVVAPEELPFEKVFGKEIGEFFLKKHKEAGTKFKLGQSVKEFRGNGTVKQVILNNGDRLDADMVIFGTGVEPATNFKSGPKTAEDGSFKVDQYFRVDKEIYAAGDIATFIDWRTGEKLRIEHWRTAEQQGMLAGRNMAGAKEQYRSVPFFWTRQAGINLVYVGHATEWDQTKTIGSISKGDFITFYIKKGNILAAAGMGRAKQMDAIHELMRIDKMPSPDEIKEETDFVELVK